MRVNFRIPEILFGALIAVAIFAMGMMFESQRHLANQPADINAKQIQQHQDQIAFSWDWLTRDGAVFFTFVLAFIAGIQAYLFVRQLRYMNTGIADTAKAAKAADLSARAAIALQLPIIRIRPDIIGHTETSDGTTKSEYCSVDRVVLSNLGATKAFPVEILYGYTVGNKLPETPSYQFSDTLSSQLYLGT